MSRRKKTIPLCPSGLCKFKLKRSSPRMKYYICEVCFYEVSVAKSSLLNSLPKKWSANL